MIENYCVFNKKSIILVLIISKNTIFTTLLR